MPLRSAKVIFSQLEKSWTEKYPSNRFNHLSTTFASIYPSNMVMSKFTCTLKGVAPLEWLLDVDAQLVGCRWRNWEKLSIISFLDFWRPEREIFWYDLLVPHLSCCLPWAAVGVCKADLAKVQPDQALTPYTPTLLGTCKEVSRKRRLL